MVNFSKIPKSWGMMPYLKSEHISCKYTTPKPSRQKNFFLCRPLGWGTILLDFYYIDRIKKGSYFMLDYDSLNSHSTEA